MIETVQERQRGAYNFDGYYENLCALQDTCPIPAVRAHLSDGVLDINGDRIRHHDWTPIFNSIKINKNLSFIAIRSYFQLNLSNGMPEKKAKVMRSRIPIIRTKEMTNLICKALRDCLVTTESLACIEIQGIFLNESDINTLGQGIMKNHTLKHLSLEGCRIGDSGLTALCSALKLAGNVGTLNLTSCSFSSVGLKSLGDLIKYQTMSRHNEAWKESLRYRWANFDTMCGIRRLTLNNNPAIGDEGACILAESLKDDLWVKAIDLQECGLGNSAVRGFLSVLKYNATLVVLDMRLNPKIDKDLLRSVTEKVLINGNGKETEYKWLRIEDLRKNREETYDRHPRTYYNGPSKPLIHSARPAFKPAGGRLRSKSVSSLDRDNGGYCSASDDHHQPRRTSHNKENNQHIPQRVQSARSHSSINSANDNNSVRHGNKSGKGQPWRTAARANRYKGYPPDHVPGKRNLEEHFEPITDPKSIQLDENEQEINPSTQKPIRNHSNIGKSNKIETKKSDNHIDDDSTNASSVVGQLIQKAQEYPPIPDDNKKLKTEVLRLRGQVDKYKQERYDTELKIKEICKENERLRNSMNLMSRSNRIISDKTQEQSILQDKAILESIEVAFNQFDAFLDMLRQSGLEKIVTAAGMDEFSEDHRQIMAQVSAKNNQRLSHNHESQTSSRSRQSSSIASSSKLKKSRTKKAHNRRMEDHIESENSSKSRHKHGNYINKNVRADGDADINMEIFNQPSMNLSADQIIDQQTQPQQPLIVNGDKHNHYRENNTNLAQGDIEMTGHNPLSDVGWIEELNNNEDVQKNHESLYNEPNIKEIEIYKRPSPKPRKPQSSSSSSSSASSFNPTQNKSVQNEEIRNTQNNTSSPQEQYHDDFNDGDYDSANNNINKGDNNDIEQFSYNTSNTISIKSSSIHSPTRKTTNQDQGPTEIQNQSQPSYFNQPQASIDGADEISLDEEYMLSN